MEEAVRVMVVDDAAFMRRFMVKLLKDEPGIEVVGVAVDGAEAVELFDRLRPDVVCLDIDMPKMNGVLALKHIMSKRPTPVIIISSMTDRDDIPFEVLRLGVIDFFPKPSSLSGELSAQSIHLVHLIRNAARVQRKNLHRLSLLPPQSVPQVGQPCQHMMAVGGTLGSVSALLQILIELPAEAKSELSVICKVPLHPMIRASFLASVDRYLGWPVVIPTGSVPLRTGTLYFVPWEAAVSVGEAQIVVGEAGEGTGLDTFFAAAGQRFGERTTLILLAGDRMDGLEGLREASGLQAQCFIQDERTALFSSWSPQVSGELRLVELDQIVRTVLERMGLRPELMGA